MALGCLSCRALCAHAETARESARPGKLEMAPVWFQVDRKTGKWITESSDDWWSLYVLQIKEMYVSKIYFLLLLYNYIRISLAYRIVHGSHTTFQPWKRQASSTKPRAPCGLDGFPDRVFSALLVVEGQHLPPEGALEMSHGPEGKKTCISDIKKKAAQIPNCECNAKLEKNQTPGG